MKKNLLVGFMIFCMIFVFGSKLFPVDAGIKVGMSKVNVSLSTVIPEVDFNSRTEFIMGAFISIKCFKLLAVQPEVYYLNKGVNSTEYSEFTEYKFSYLEIPVLLKFKIPIPGNIKPAIFAGPYAAFNINAREIETEYGETDETDLKEFVKKMDYGLVFGGCLEYKLGFGKLILDIRYNLGLVNAMKYLKILTSGVMDDDDSVKNRYFAIMAGFSFNI